MKITTTERSTIKSSYKVLWIQNTALPMYSLVDLDEYMMLGCWRILLFTVLAKMELFFHPTKLKS